MQKIESHCNQLSRGQLLLGAHCESLSKRHFEDKDDELALGRMSRVESWRIGFDQVVSTAVTGSPSSTGAGGSVTGSVDGTCMSALRFSFNLVR